VAAVILAALAATTVPAQAAATPAAADFAPCAGQRSFQCTTIAVPLDRSAALPGSLLLHVARKLAGATPASSAVVGLAGGPGQAALPLAADLAQEVTPALHSRDMIVFDQRGTGESDPLSCHALQGTSATLSQFQVALGQCAEQLGPQRGGFTTAESVQDIETIRQDLGYQRLVLYGTSYGTKVALEYAERYPEHVEALLLDSVVLPNGPEPFALSTFGAITPVLDELCSHGACAGITTNPVADVARLATRLAARPLAGTVDNGYGHLQHLSLGATELLDILEAGDLNPALRALLPAAVRSALGHNPGPLLQLKALADGLIPNVPPIAGEQFEEEINEGLFWTTTCEEQLFPWQRNAPGPTRNAETLTAWGALPATDFYPFGAHVGLMASSALDCIDWPNAAPAPPPTGALPDVPTLILSGGQDLRTPTSNARAVAAAIPGSQLEVVPYTGHSVLGSDFTGCAAGAVAQFAAGQPVAACPPAHDLFAPTPVTPTNLARVKPAAGVPGKAGRTVTAVLDTFADLDRLVVAATLQAERELPSGARFGGLRGGYARLTRSAVTLHGFSFVPGVKLTGTLTVKHGKLQPRPIAVGGATAAHGTVTIGTGHRVKGTLEGRSFNVTVKRAVLATVSHQTPWPGQSTAGLAISGTLLAPAPALARLP
jgi:pimeloyl-ACP methyl ester carboxylesterase